MLMVCCLTWGQTYELRLLNHWDNPNGTVERGFAGRSIWKWEEIPAGKGSMPKELKARYEEYGRINKAYGINGTVLNNVNAKPIALSLTARSRSVRGSRGLRSRMRSRQRSGR